MSKGPQVVKSMVMSITTPLHNAQTISKVVHVIYRFLSNMLCLFRNYCFPLIVRTYSLLVDFFFLLVVKWDGSNIHTRYSILSLVCIWSKIRGLEVMLCPLLMVYVNIYSPLGSNLTWIDRSFDCDNGIGMVTLFFITQVRIKDLSMFLTWCLECVDSSTNAWEFCCRTWDLWIIMYFFLSGCQYD